MIVAQMMDENLRPKDHLIKQKEFIVPTNYIYEEIKT